MLMRRIDELHMNYPFAGSRMLRDMLSHQGLEVGRRHVRTLMRRWASRLSIADQTHPNPRQDAVFILPVAWSLDHAAQSGLGHGHYYIHGARLRLSGCGYRLV